jgi:hypothetical protein
MNKKILLMITGSLMLLLASGIAALWMLWTSWEESHHLAQVNRELRASLEASRVRLDNFCDYPAQVLCPTEEKNRIPSSPSLADTMTAPLLPEPSLRKEESSSLPAAYTPPTESHTLPEAPEIQKQNTISDIPQGSEHTPSTSDEAMHHASQESPAAPITVSPLISPEKKAQKESPSNPQRTWITIHKGDALVFRIAGAGDHLQASAAVQSEPLRCEVTMQGLWNVFDRNSVRTPLVTGMRRSFKDDLTVLDFFLNAEPKLCSVQQEDPRTIAITVQ